MRVTRRRAGAAAAPGRPRLAAAGAGAPTVRRRPRRRLARSASRRVELAGASRRRARPRRARRRGIGEYCEAVIRLPTSDVDRTLTDAGWFLFGAVRAGATRWCSWPMPPGMGCAGPGSTSSSSSWTGRFAGTLLARPHGLAHRRRRPARHRWPPSRELTADFLRYGGDRPAVLLPHAHHRGAASRSFGARRDRWWCRWETVTRALLRARRSAR